MAGDGWHGGRSEFRVPSGPLRGPGDRSPQTAGETGEKGLEPPLTMERRESSIGIPVVFHKLFKRNQPLVPVLFKKG